MPHDDHIDIQINAGGITGIVFGTIVGLAICCAGAFIWCNSDNARRRRRGQALMGAQQGVQANAFINTPNTGVPSVTPVPVVAMPRGSESVPMGCVIANHATAGTSVQTAQATYPTAAAHTVPVQAVHPASQAPPVYPATAYATATPEATAVYATAAPQATAVYATATPEVTAVYATATPEATAVYATATPEATAYPPVVAAVYPSTQTGGESSGPVVMAQAVVVNPK